MDKENQPPICDYEGSDYQTRFWEKGGRDYEDGCEGYALKKLLPRKGEILLELGAGAGRNTSRYDGFEQIVLLDYSRTQLQLARERLGGSRRFIYVVADIYHLPFIDKLFDSATMIRVLHHMADAESALTQIRNTLKPGATFILEFANKRNVKAILRYALGKQTWNPFQPEPIEYAPLNFDFHPRSVYSLLTKLEFTVERIHTVSHFRINLLKSILPTKLLIWMDSLLQWTGKFVQLTPSIFIRARLAGEKITTNSRYGILDIFKCPKCNYRPLEQYSGFLFCKSCGSKWPIQSGLYIFKDTS